MNTQPPHDSSDPSPYSSYQPDRPDVEARRSGQSDSVFDTDKMRAEAEQKLNEAADQAREKLGELQGTVENYIREKPVQTLLVAAGVGLVVGTLLKR